ncbi:MAG: hypothetical protein KC442_12850, partial [Thermomicrobiales bacterium]|nr:hypothetical protein [Thermomicrobiales bacterium]
QLPWPLAVGWLVSTVGLASFILVGSVRIGAGHWLGQRLRVRVVWVRFLDYLADQGAGPVMVGLVAVAAVVALLGSLALVWFVLGLRDAEPEAPDAP